MFISCYRTNPSSLSFDVRTLFEPEGQWRRNTLSKQSFFFFFFFFFFGGGGGGQAIDHKQCLPPKPPPPKKKKKKKLSPQSIPAPLLKGYVILIFCIDTCFISTAAASRGVNKIWFAWPVFL